VANDKATSVIEKTTPATVIIDPAMIPSTALAPSAPPVNSRSQRRINQFMTGRSRATLMKARSTAALAMTAGMNHKLDRIRSQHLIISIFTTNAPLSRSWCRSCNTADTIPDLSQKSSGFGFRQAAE
jgi:hypothetical protein